MNVNLGDLPVPGGFGNFGDISAMGKRIMWSMVQYKELQMSYRCAMREIRTKFEVLDEELDLKRRRNPICSIQTRLKSTDGVISKLVKYGKPLTVESIEEYVKDFAGVRVICSYIDDIYAIADAFLAQDDVTALEIKDYIKNPKPNGYRSLHLIVSVPVFFSNQRKDVKCEVQLRTVAMDFWASNEHQIRYKHKESDDPHITDELKACADMIAEADMRMMKLRERVDAADKMENDEESELVEYMRMITKSF